ncbi:MAG: pentapeptide repeat-containing protein [Bacteroidota bacterium]
MSATILDDKTFTELNYAKTTERNTEFNNCIFKKCDFSEAEFAGCKFIDCVFDNCNLAMMKLDRSTLHNITFKDCKILGVNFSAAEDFLFTVSFESCMLDYCSFMRKKMPKTVFKKSSLKEATFTQAILTGSVFDECNLLETVFRQTDLTAVNFSTALNYIIDPELNTMKKAIFSAHGLEGLLFKYDLKIV